MSWILAAVGREPLLHRTRRFASLHADVLYKDSHGAVYVAAGGVPETCLHGHFHAGNPFHAWLIAGVGIIPTAGGCRFATAGDWQAVLARPAPQESSPEGHYVAVRWSEEAVECFTDRFGLRTLFLAGVSGGAVFSTRLQWVARLTRRSSVNFEELGSRWETFNPLSYESAVHGIVRLGPGGTAKIAPGSMALSHRPWSPPPPDSPGSPVEEILRRFVHPQVSPPASLSLGLSGGLDSRAILSLLLPEKRAFSLHLFGSEVDPDVTVSRRIAQKERLPQVFFPATVPPAGACLAMARDYAAQTLLVEPVSSIIRLQFYPVLQRQNKIVIDGGLGEIARRQYLRRLALLGGRSLRIGNYRLLVRHLRMRRAPIFNPEVRSVMEEGVVRQFGEAIECMPDPSEIGIGNFVDLLAVRYRFPNFAGPEQARMDEHVLSCMPFAQPSVVNAVFAAPIALRKNGKLLRRLIRTCTPRLARYPLAKAGATFPFSLPPLAGTVLAAVRRKVGRLPVDPTPADFLYVLSEFIQDTVRSARVRTYEPYDLPYLEDLVRRFYAGETSLARELDWWLTFELWRESLQCD